MSESMLSNHWYRVADVRPRLRMHLPLQRQRFRGETWYLLQDPASTRIHRFTPSARYVIAAMDGQRSVQQIWDLAQRDLGDDAPSQDEVIRLLGQLHSADLLHSDTLPDAAELFERGERQERQHLRKSWLNPMAIRIHLVDPDRWLNRLKPLIDAVWNRWGLLLWLLVVGPALLLLPSQWDELTGNLADRVLATSNLALLALVFPVVKVLHELGHGIAVKRGGGEVHDMGVVLLVLLPVPYVEASAATMFRSKHERAMVGAAGLVVELFVAALAFHAWMLIEPSVTRSVLFNVMLIAGVSALLFNGNPLLRYDAYYILADLIEMPNLAQRSLRYWGYLIERYAYGSHDAQTSEHRTGDKVWLAVYGVLSTIYRVFVTIAIALFIASGFFFIGVLLALWAVAAMAVLPLLKGLKHMATSPGLRVHRRRVWGVTGGVVALLALVLFGVPAPSRTVVEGVAWLPSQALVRAGHAGFVERVVAAPGSAVAEGELLIELVDPELRARHRAAQARVAELEAVHGAYLSSDRAQAAIARDQLEAARHELAEQTERVSRLQVRAASAGTFVLPDAANMPGRHVRQGELLGHVLDSPRLLARVVVEQAAADLVRHATTGVALRVAHRPEFSVPARLAREVPAGDEVLPSRALTTEGGGRLAVDPRDGQSPRTLERTFQFDVEVDDAGSARTLFFGERVYARFEHPSEPLARQWWRDIRRLFLSRFGV